VDNSTVSGNPLNLKTGDRRFIVTAYEPTPAQITAAIMEYENRIMTATGGNRHATLREQLDAMRAALIAAEASK